MRSPRLLFTSESVTEGHPDKVCDQISDAILDMCLSRNRMARVACEASVKSSDSWDWVAVYGEITPLPGEREVRDVVRSVLTDIGYTNPKYGASAKDSEIAVRLTGQSADIARGVSPQAEEGTVGAGDQGMMIGFACDETPEYMPLTVHYAHALCQKLAAVRKSGQLPYLRPDGKAQVTVEYCEGKPVRVDAVVVSAQHDDGISHAQIVADVKAQVIEPVIDAKYLDSETKYFINPTENFVIGGPLGDSGLTGRKIIVDTYGGVARHGGGAFSGKDPTKVDRSGAYAARYVAKNVVAAGLADRFEVQLAYAIGVAEPVSISFETFGTEHVDEEVIERLIRQHFNLTPAGIIGHLDLRRPIYRQTAAYGHFGRQGDAVAFPWERVDLAATLAAGAGLPGPRAAVPSH
jgi:S-adenosylmethionine synthetase